MNKIAIALGTILILSGLILLSVQGTQQLTINGKDHIYKQTDEENPEWSIPPAYFKKGEILSLKYRIGANWGWPPNDLTSIEGVVFERVKVLYVKFTETSSGNYTEFAVFLIIPPPPYDPSQISAHPRIEITHNGGVLAVLNYTKVDEYGTVQYYTEENIGGMAKYNGSYAVATELYFEGGPKLQNIVEENNQTHTEWVNPDPPTNLYLYNLSVEVSYPYKSLLIASPVTMGIGVVAFVWGTKKNKSKIPHKKLVQAK
jgi:hypothetical protein